MEFRGWSFIKIWDTTTLCVWLHVNQRFQADILICVIPKKRMYTPIRVVKMQNPDATRWPGRGATEPPFSAGGNAPRCSRFDGFL